MNETIQKVLHEADEYIKNQAAGNKFGDITVTISLKDGVPVKLTKIFCEHFVQRKPVKVGEIN